MKKIYLPISVPEVIMRLCIVILLAYRKHHFGYPFRKIELTKGKYAIVDPEDFDSLSKFSWYVMAGTHSFYAYRSVTIFGRKKAIAMHNHIMQPPLGYVVDHDNHEGLDNRKANLHIATISQNNCNRRRMSNCRSKYRGVDYVGPRKINLSAEACPPQTGRSEGGWRARIRFNNKRILLGYFDNEIDAAHAYDNAAKELHREFAVLNFAQVYPVRCRSYLIGAKEIHRDFAVLNFESTERIITEPEATATGELKNNIAEIQKYLAP